MTITLQLPLPSPKLRPNGPLGQSKGARFVYQSEFRKAKAAAVAEAGRVLKDLGIAPPRWAQASYVVTQFHATPQHMDPDNLIASCKAYCDGIAKAGIVANDKHFFPDRPRFVRVERMPRIEIEITPEF